MGKMQVIWSGEAELPTGWALQPHSHEFFHLAYAHRGRLVFRADGLDYPIAEGSLILFPPGVVHAVPQDTHNLCTQYEVMFYIQDPELQGLLDTGNVLVLHEASHLEHLFSYIRMYYKSSDPLCSSCVESFLRTILLSILVDKADAEGSVAGYVDSSQYSPLVQRILCHVEKDCDRKYDLAGLAISLGRNKNYLCTVFHRETGVTISDYINYHRIREMLVTLQYNGYNKEVPIRELADQFGYANASYFNRVFKKYTGMTPTEFINALSKTAGNPAQSAFQIYYHEYLDLKRFPIRESLEFMRGLKDAYTDSLLQIKR